MQITLANETLSMCIGNVDDVKNKISQRNKSRQQRMNDFLRFIVQDDHNVIQFDKVLRKNGLQEVLHVKCKDDLKEGCISIQDIGRISKSYSALYLKYTMNDTAEFGNKVIFNTCRKNVCVILMGQLYK